MGGRARIVYSNSRDPEKLRAAGLAPASMDVIVDDGDHRYKSQEKTLLTMWPLLKEGGFYFIEDIATGLGGGERYPVIKQEGKGWITQFQSRDGTTPLVHDEGSWAEEYKAILASNDVFFADTMLGHADIKQTWKLQANHRTFEEEAARRGSVYRVPGDRVNHNSHMLVIRKRG